MTEIDPLYNVKRFFIGAAWSGFGARQFVDTEMLHPGLRFLHDVVVPKLWQAILADDPAYNPEGEPTTARGNAAVKFFVAFMEGFREWEVLANPTGDVWHVLFEPGQHGDFMGELCTALQADDPTWSPTPWSRNGPAVHPSLMPEENADA